MDLPDLLRLARRRWTFIVTAVVVCVLAAGAYALSLARTYTSSVEFFVTTRATDASSAYEGGLYVTNRVASYAAAATSEQLAARVVTDLSLKQSPTDLARQITATVPQNTTLIDVSVSASSAAQAQRNGAGVAAQFPPLVTQLEGGRASIVTVQVLHPATLPTAPSAPRRKLDVLVGLLVGIAVGLLGAVMLDRRDTNVLSPEDVEERLGLRGLGRVGGRADRPWPGTDRLAPEWRDAAVAVSVLAREQRASTVAVRGITDVDERAAVAENLAAALASTGANVLLVLARPSRLAPASDHAPALGDDAAPLVRVSERLSVVSVKAGAAGERDRDLRELLDRATRRDLHLVLVALPDLTGAGDNALSACDALLLVVEPGSVSSREVLTRLRPLRPSDSHVLGCLLAAPEAWPRADASGEPVRREPASAR